MLTSITAFGFLLLIVALTAGCDKKQEHHGDDHHADGGKDWKEMDHFHTVMADAFHPYKDSSDLQPAKGKAQELVTAAKAWRNSEAPEGIDKDKLESRLDKLVSLSEELQSEVAGGKDETIASKLTELHDLFHELQNEFYGAGSEGHGDHHHHE